MCLYYVFIAYSQSDVLQQKLLAFGRSPTLDLSRSLASNVIFYESPLFSNTHTAGHIVDHFIFKSA